MRGTADPGGTPLPAGDLQAVLRNRLEQATAAAREVAGLAAAVGTNFTLDLLTEASDLDADAVVAAVDELWRRRIMREFRDGYDFSHDLLREAAYAQVSPPKRWLLHRRIAQGLELLHADDTDAVAAQLAEQYARGGRPSGRWPTTGARPMSRRACSPMPRRSGCTGRRCRSCADHACRARTGTAQELAVLEAMAAPLNARYGYSSPELQRTLERSIALAESLGRKDSTRHRPGRAVGVAVRPGAHRRQLPDGHPRAEPRRPGLRAERPGSFRRRRVGGQPGAGRPRGCATSSSPPSWRAVAVSLSVGTRSDVHGMAWAAHAHWLLGHDDEALSACREAIELARAIDHPYSLAVALAYGCITHQMRHDLPALREAVGELRELCDRYDFAYYREWGLILDGWSAADQAGIDLARRGIDNLKSQGSFARMPYWLSLLADLSARVDQPGAARATLDAALAAGRAHDDLWWLPEVMRMRAAYDERAGRHRAAALRGADGVGARQCRPAPALRA